MSLWKPSSLLVLVYVWRDILAEDLGSKLFNFVVQTFAIDRNAGFVFTWYLAPHPSAMHRRMAGGKSMGIISARFDWRNHQNLFVKITTEKEGEEINPSKTDQRRVGRFGIYSGSNRTTPAFRQDARCSCLRSGFRIRAVSSTNRDRPLPLSPSPQQHMSSGCVFFWSDKARQGGRRWNVFSNWYPAPFCDPTSGRRYAHTEQYMMAQKVCLGMPLGLVLSPGYFFPLLQALLFGDEAIHKAIMATSVHASAFI